MAERSLVAILDFGSQYSRLIARALREMEVYCELFAPTVSPRTLRRRGARAIILSGGPQSVYDRGAILPAREIYEMGLPVLGICYGTPAVAQQLGGRVAPSREREYGRTEIRVLRASRLFGDLERRLVGWMSHGDVVRELPPGFEVLAVSERELIAAMAHEQRRLYGVQFHPEVTHTPWGKDILRNFVFRIAGLQRNWRMGDFVEEAVQRIREQAPTGHIICAVSGGIDSVTTAVLTHRAVGERMTAIFVNHGLLRLGEAEEIRTVFRKTFNIPFIYVDARKRFLEALRNVRSPERKRKIIGHEFVRQFEEVANRIPDARYLAQGTLYPDVIESRQGTRGPAHRIKSHHNVGGLPRRMQLKVIEPLRYLFKDEVRRIAALLGIPESIRRRQPFPGPGLAIRVIGEVTAERLEILRKADRIVTEEIEREGLDAELWQYFAILPAIRTVGVMGDQRTYAYPIVVRVVTSTDGMTADGYPLPYEVMSRITRRIVNEVENVNRVLFDFTSKPPATIEWE